MSERMKNKKVIILVLISILILSMLSGCGGGSNYADTYSSADNAYAYRANGAGSASSGWDLDFNSVSKSSSINSESYYESAEEPAYTSESEPETTSEVAEQKLVYTSDLSIETKDMREALAAIYGMIEETGGIVQSEDLSNMDTVYNDAEYYSSGYRKTGASGRIYVRIPQKNYETFINGLYNQEGLLFVTSSSKSIENMTDVYYDVETYLRTLRTELDRLYKFMESATTTKEMLEIEDRITEVQYKIESCTNTLKTIDYDVDYAKVTITLKEVLKYTQIPTEKKTFIERIKGHFEESGSDFVEFLEDVLVFFIYVVPYLIFFGIITIVVIIIVKKYRVKHPKKEKIEKRNKCKEISREVTNKNRKKEELKSDLSRKVSEEQKDTPSIDQIQD